MLYVQILTLVVTIPLGVVLGVSRGGKTFDNVETGSRSSRSRFPMYCRRDRVLLVFFGVQLGLFPSAVTSRSPTDPAALQAPHLPVTALTMGRSRSTSRLLRSDMIATLQEDFILMAKSKGISTRASCGVTRCARQPHAAHGRRSQRRHADQWAR